jgi:hypothetical protein
MDSPQTRNPIVKNIMVSLAVLFLGFVLLILTYTLDHALQFSVAYLIKILFNHDPTMELLWFPQAIHILFIFIVSYISFLILGSDLSITYKASYAMVPFALIYTTFFIFYFPWPDFVYFISILFYVSVFYFFYKVKVHWLYYYSFTLVSLSLYIISLSLTNV